MCHGGKYYFSDICFFSASEQNPRQKQIRYVQTTTEILNIRGTGELRYPTTQTYIGVKNEVFLNNFIMFLVYLTRLIMTELFVIEKL